ncbi:Hypothetical predicted protein [Pelobates cultripes]|uniref:Uncharacterized protein n=1 Tax=Pelobates cultripes TaxID=61616 RepID=A0AAD1TMA1_PELCU|nr:Hypothetical predicted protein [Pelobates cultripes]
MGGGKKARNSAVAPIFRQKPEQTRAPSSEAPLTDSDSEMSSHAHSERTEAPLTRNDMRGFLADFKQSVAEELEKRLCPILATMSELSARTQATEDKMAATEETHLTRHGLRYAWGHPFRIIIRKDGRFHSITKPEEIPTLLDQLDLPQLPDTAHPRADQAHQRSLASNLPTRPGERMHRNAALNQPENSPH